ncbi:MAG: N-acetylmannosamine-6-phosphate 2-epimerase [Rhodoglobus sp.]
MAKNFPHGIVVSCQAYPGEPLRDPYITRQMALSAVWGGATAVRVQGLDDIRETVGAVDVPVIGIWKDGGEGVVITPTLGHAIAVMDAGADIVAIDGTRRARPDGQTLAEVVFALRAHGSVVVMADCGSLDDARAAEAAGVDVLGTTLSGYSGERPMTSGPDLELVEMMARYCSLPIVAEGRYRTPSEAAAAIAAGAAAVCVGTAITHPTTITSGFVTAIAEQGTRRSSMP